MDPPKKVLIFWVKEEYWRIIEIKGEVQKKMVLEMKHGPFTTEEKAEDACKFLFDLNTKINSRLSASKFFQLFLPRFKDVVFTVQKEIVPANCLVLQFPNDSESRLIFDAIYSGSKPEHVIYLVDPSKYDLAWIKLTSFGIFVESLVGFI